MKKSKIILVLFIVVAIVGGCMLLKEEKEVNNDYIRIHIRANSDESYDQDVKYKVRDGVIDYLVPFLADCFDFESAKAVLKQNLTSIEDKANTILKENGFSYTAKVKLTKEEFPAREYDGLVLEGGVYEALIVELGEAEGANWWCVAFPPLCFVPNGKNIVYKSKILEIINRYK